MRAAEADQLARLVGRAVATTSERVHELHAAIAGRVFSGLRLAGLGPASTPARVLHDGISALSYGAVGLTARVGAQLAGSLAATADPRQPRLVDRPQLRRPVAFLNGAWGDLLESQAPALAVRMSIRHDGRDLAPSPSELRAAFPSAGGRVVVFLHGLVESDGSWVYRPAPEAEPTTYGSQLARDLGCTPVLLRYNSGLHISTNGAHLDRLLTDLVTGWPVPVEQLVLVGHSMGGLVIRSALARTSGPWAPLVRATVSLGTPHLGAPLEQRVHQLVAGMSRIPETRPLAALLRTRAAGIKDLRHGALADADWDGTDLDAWPSRRPSHVPLAEGVRHLAVLTTLPGPPLVGDLLVHPRSAVGDTRRPQDSLGYPGEDVRRLRGLHHFQLLGHPAVYAALLGWLRSVCEQQDQPAPGHPQPQDGQRQ